MSVYLLKSRFQTLLSPIANFLGTLGISPNAITMSAIALSALFPLISYFIIDYPVLWITLPLILIIRMGLNALDGMVASRFNLKSKEGEVLNEAGDVISDTAIAVGFIIVEPSLVYVISIFILLSVFSEYASILIKAVFGHRSYRGPMGKSDRAMVEGVIGAAMAFNYVSVSSLNMVFVVVNLLLLITIFNRITDHGLK